MTVSFIAKRVGIDHYDQYIDVSSLKDEEIEDAVNKYTVFGRVTPEQKKLMVVALQKHHHTVAMTGDGINDVLALKIADCSIAMASGSDAAKNTANIVLLDNNFDSLPHVVHEGRRVINNITASASMYLIKTIFSNTSFSCCAYPLTISTKFGIKSHLFFRYISIVENASFTRFFHFVKLLYVIIPYTNIIPNNIIIYIMLFPPFTLMLSYFNLLINKNHKIENKNPGFCVLLLNSLVSHLIPNF